MSPRRFAFDGVEAAAPRLNPRCTAAPFAASPAAAPLPSPGATPCHQPALGIATGREIGFATLHSFRRGPAWLGCAQTFSSGDLSVRLRHLGSASGPCDTLIVDRGMQPLQLCETDAHGVACFDLNRLSALDVRNGEVKLEFLKPSSSGLADRHPPLVVLTFGRGGLLTHGQFGFLQQLTQRVAGQPFSSPGTRVQLGLPDEIEVLPQRYTQTSRRWLPRVLWLWSATAHVQALLDVYYWLFTVPSANSAFLWGTSGLTTVLLELASLAWVAYSGFGRLWGGAQWVGWEAGGSQGGAALLPGKAAAASLATTPVACVKAGQKRGGVGSARRRRGGANDKVEGVV